MCVGDEGGAVHRPQRRPEASPFQFKSHHQHLWTGDILGAVWSGKLPIRKFAGCVYVPGQGEVISGGKWGGRYNTWRKGGVEPKRNDELAQVFIDHIDRKSTRLNSSH